MSDKEIKFYANELHLGNYIEEIEEQYRENAVAVLKSLKENGYIYRIVIENSNILVKISGTDLVLNLSKKPLKHGSKKINEMEEVFSYKDAYVYDNDYQIYDVDTENTADINAEDVVEIVKMFLGERCYFSEEEITKNFVYFPNEYYNSPIKYHKKIDGILQKHVYSLVLYKKGMRYYMQGKELNSKDVYIDEEKEILHYVYQNLAKDKVLDPNQYLSLVTAENYNEDSEKRALMRLGVDTTLVKPVQGNDWTCGEDYRDIKEIIDVKDKEFFPLENYDNKIFVNIKFFLQNYGMSVEVADITFDRETGMIKYSGCRRAQKSSEIDVSGIIGKIYLPDSNGIVNTHKGKFIVRNEGYILPQRFEGEVSLDERIKFLEYEDIVSRKLRYKMLRNIIKYIDVYDISILDDFYEEMIEDSKKQWEIINGSMDGYGEWKTEEELEIVRKISERITFSAEDSEYILEYKNKI